MTAINKSRIIVCLSSCILVCLFLVVPLRSARADELSDPKEEEVTVTASVAAKNPPPAPVLIEPEKGAILRSGRVKFEWYQVTGHSRPLDRYEINIDGKEWRDLPLVDNVTDDYTLVYENGRATLRLRTAAQLADGSYTWKIRVVDVQDLGADSSTWSFSIDSAVPPLIITQVGPHQTSVSATDPGTFPAQPYEVRTARPVINGVTESFSEVQLVVTFADGSTEHYKTTLGGNPNFSITLNPLPANVPVHLTFTVIDPAGNTTVLDAIDVVYIPRVLVIPLPPIIPGLPVIEIPLPDIPIPSFPQPTPTPSLPPGASPSPALPDEPPVFQVYERPMRSMWWWWSSLLSFGLGSLLVAWLIGVPWGALWWWFPRWLWAVFWPGSTSRHTVKNWQSQKLLAWFPMQLQWMDSQRRLRTLRRVSNDIGEWRYPETLERVYQWLGVSYRWQYPVVGPVSDTRDAVSAQRTLALHGESFQSTSQSGGVSTANVYVLSPNVAFAWVAWVQPLTRTAQKWWSWLPRVLWLVAAGLAVWGAYLIPVWWSWAWALCLLWWLVRDLAIHSPRILQEYVE